MFHDGSYFSRFIFEWAGAGKFHLDIFLSVYEKSCVDSIVCLLFLSFEGLQKSSWDNTCARKHLHKA